MDYVITTIFGGKATINRPTADKNLVEWFKGRMNAAGRDSSLPVSALNPPLKLGDCNFDVHRFQAVERSFILAVFIGPKKDDLPPVTVALSRGGTIVVGVSSMVMGHATFQWQEKPWMAIQDLERMYDEFSVYHDIVAGSLYIDYIRAVKLSLDAASTV